MVSPERGANYFIQHPRYSVRRAFDVQGEIPEPDHLKPGERIAISLVILAICLIQITKIFSAVTLEISRVISDTPLYVEPSFSRACTTPKLSQCSVILCRRISASKLLVLKE